MGLFLEETGIPIIHVGFIYVHVQVVPIRCHNLGSYSPSDTYISRSLNNDNIHDLGNLIQINHASYRVYQMQKGSDGPLLKVIKN